MVNRIVRWITDIRPKNISTFSDSVELENGETETVEYKSVEAHPILNKVLDELAFIRTHVGAIWYNKLGGKTLKDKLDEMDFVLSTRVSLTGGMEILEGEDLDTKTKIGNYYCSLNKTANTLLNNPSVHAFTLRVDHPTGIDSHIRQILSVYDSGDIYMRLKVVSTGKWTEWRLVSGRVLDYTILPAVSSVTLPSSGYSSIKHYTDDTVILFATIHHWGSASGAFNVCVANEGKYVYVYGAPGVRVTNLHVKCWFYR